MAHKANSGDIGPVGKEKAVFSEGFKELVRGLGKLRRRMQVTLKELEYREGPLGGKQYSDADFMKLAMDSLHTFGTALAVVPRAVADCINSADPSDIDKDSALVALDIAKRHIEEVVNRTEKVAEAEVAAYLVPHKDSLLEFSVALMKEISSFFRELGGWLEYEGQYVDRESTLTINKVVNLQPYIDRCKEALAPMHRHVDEMARQAEARSAASAQPGCSLFVVLVILGAALVMALLST